MDVLAGSKTPATVASYISQISTDGNHLHSLIDKLKEISPAGDPIEGYARSLSDLSTRMQNSCKILAKELRIHPISTKAASLDQSDLVGFFPPERKDQNRYQNFL